MFSAFNNNSCNAAAALKQAQQQQQLCRSTCDMDVDDSGGGLMSKLARTGDSSTIFMSSSSSQQVQQHHAASELRMQQMMTSGGGALESLVRSNSMLSDGRLVCSPTNSTASDGGPVLATLHDAPTLLSADHTRPSARSDSIASLYDGMGARYLYRHPHSTYTSLHQGHPSGLPLAISGNMSASTSRAQALFTPVQLRELQHQALVLKYIMNGVNVPAELVNPLRTRITGLSAIAAGSPHLSNLLYGGYRLGYGATPDPEPGRCRRTDGKKWRCARDVVPDQKYCERHIHRGRHRTRKPTDSQLTGSSPGVSATSASSTGGASSVTLAPTRTPSGILSTVTVSSQQQQLSPNLGIRQYSGTNSPSASGLSVGSSITASQYNQMPLHPSGASALSSKDLRYINGIAKSDLELGAEQMLFAEATGSSRAIAQDDQAISHHGLAMLSSINNSWRTASMQQSRAPSPIRQQQPLKTSSPSMMMQYNSPQLRALMGQDFNLMSAEENSASLHSMAQHNQQHQHSFLGRSVEAVNSVGREPECQPLRHFFDDWPRSKDASTLSWSDVEDEKPNRNSTPQLSISIPISSSADFNATGSPPGKLKLSPLKLSMSRAGEDDIPLGVELGVGMGVGINEDRHHRHHQTNWIPIAWETPVGGPLAEVLQSSTPGGASKHSGLNLMTEGWEESPRDSPSIASSLKSMIPVRPNQ